MNYLFASTNFGCEKFLEQELLSLGGKNIKIIKGGVYYEGEDLILYNSLMWSRISSRIFLCIKKFTIKNSDDLYHNTYNINWTKILYLENNFLVKFNGTNNIIRNSLFGSLTIKDSIVDKFYQKYSIRPNINLITPDIRITAYLFQNSVHIMLDLSGDALNKRGYRKFFDVAPIKENLSSAIILSSGWKKNTPLIDPMCGSGTLLIEAAMMSSDRAPGLTRKKWGFQSWKGYNEKIWKEVLKNAKERFKIGIKKCVKNYFIGYDCNPNIIEKAQKNAINANLENIVNFVKCDLSNLKNPYQKQEIGTLISNPPYGERYKTENNLIALYIELGVISRKHFKNWKLSVFSSSEFLLKFLQMKSYENFIFKNGSLNCTLKNYEIFSNTINDKSQEYQNRLQKNFKKLKKWNDLQEIECFRVYDSDLPNYKIIVDVYKKWLVIQEYQAPKLIHHKEAHKRLCNAIYHSKEILSIPTNNIVIKFRKKQKNKEQYQKLFNSGSFFIIKEYHVKLLVNLIDYLDTGLFSENRLVRKLLGEMSKGKDFLNLFAYTGAASVYAGLGKARSTTTVDISNTYIGWSMRNMSLNNLTNSKNVFIQKDCLEWIVLTKKKFDLIFINPPTFSNSKRMKKSFELKRDYIELMINLKRILRKDGNIVFSSSTHNFEIDCNNIKKINLHAKNITNLTQTKDHLKKNYHSWLIKHIQ
ncbi:bifunctional 23S rRNA (guanine(2069)-N(7))-methyltransferase RlmK/23S rRNA (guanine(2445)-N(2))-methyltransferase RlmL [Buchnera aphidicola]|uniref:Ribosomal RNA large subunit methyltransferase K/L n=1 Tax=Buchnera aphidicola subsp. Rhopalosiphum maidis TaxID=118109 RepID=A0A3G2I5K2_BUCRM|nr:bifunctional 23S rRNA (guanine(2069)-N(7))-methyltransferase RlmK/23S rRNA (guanine(2445)-N(2))-methyltransferase RlmL [Buchnera aphidicola]AYN24706.1 bifunctional 23S rRNA (guanine(2069)-N(7))-methyltransferase RlmK/23S rRNA (guanine(2445)-N(2))-methyltransferase RlmL [Buchnera aphidicola (Rhopalosiphum maidis)]